ncbi:MAG: hypothetical protein WCQ50_02240 [Spirochaetota bacterium]
MSDDMADEYDFSKGERGKFYVPLEKIVLPHYLDVSLEQNLNRLATKMGKTPDALLKIIVESELNVLEKLAL